MRRDKRFWLKSTDRWSDEETDLGIETDSSRRAISLMYYYAIDIRRSLLPNQQVTVQVLRRSGEFANSELFAEITVTGD